MMNFDEFIKEFQNECKDGQSISGTGCRVRVLTCGVR